MADHEKAEGKTVSSLVQSSFGVVVGKSGRKESHTDNGSPMTPSARLHFNSKSTAGSVSTDKLAHQHSEDELMSFGSASPKEGQDDAG